MQKSSGNGEKIFTELPLRVAFRNMSPSKTVEADIRNKAAKLGSFYGRIISCKVVVEAPHRHHHKGKLYHVRIDIVAPGGELVINREPSEHAAHGDVYVAVRDAFDAARRKLQDFARRQRGVKKIHEAAPLARVARLFTEEGYGFLKTADGREIYFHRNSVLEPGFERLEVGMDVAFAEEEGSEGPQASTVKLAGKRSLSAV